ncbi:glycosyltransferase family 2 protein [Stenotrophomonas maltophilia]|uniref:glycosyltransferase family 2 protein n=1 Tax=Stenotrophomonas maltophilia TaxID=40324 RepID=UPI00130F9434|nr:UDP-Glc:alpha-D-GlcNAc-diphosphoundecaprenol beta-1,3-glucosyltransferase WfgD [Stenotrophomonas maltophilia]
MSNVIVSVVVPTFNRANYLGRSIESALAACDGIAHEIIVVDDLSTDHTAAVVSAYDSAIVKYVRCQSRQGGGGARNVGISVASGEFIAFLDSDTVWAEEKIKKQLLVLESSSARVDGVYSLVRKVDPQGREIGIFPRRIHNENVYGNLLIDNFIDTPSAIIRREVACEIGGFDPMLPRFQDWEFFIRASQRFTFLGINEVLLDSIELPDAISKNDSARVVALLSIFDRHYHRDAVGRMVYRRMVLKVVNGMSICRDSSSARRFINSSRLSIAEKLALWSGTFVPAAVVKRINSLRKRILSRAQ